MSHSSKKNSGKPKRPKIHLLWAIVCASTSTDQQTNNFSIFNILEELQIPRIAFSPHNEGKGTFYPHELVVLLRRIISSDIDASAYDYDLVLDFMDPNGVSLQNIVTKFTFIQGKERMRVRLPLPAFPPLTNAGTYLYRIQYKLPEEAEFNENNIFEIPILIRTV